MHPVIPCSYSLYFQVSFHSTSLDLLSVALARTSRVPMETATLEGSKCGVVCSVDTSNGTFQSDIEANGIIVL